MKLQINEDELLERLEEELLADGQITCLCQHCGLEIVSDLDAQIGFCEVCNRTVALFNPYLYYL